jgi:hypothetical protein
MKNEQIWNIILHIEAPEIKTAYLRMTRGWHHRRSVPNAMIFIPISGGENKRFWPFLPFEKIIYPCETGISQSKICLGMDRDEIGGTWTKKPLGFIGGRPKGLTKGG